MLFEAYQQVSCPGVKHIAPPLSVRYWPCCCTNLPLLPACLQDLIQYNNAIRQDLARGTTDTHLQERWEMVQQCAAQIINSDLPGMQTAGQAPVKPMRWAALFSMPVT